MDIKSTHSNTLLTAALTGNTVAETEKKQTSNFQDTLNTTEQLNHADYVSGRLGISLNNAGVPASVVYFNADGTPATRSAFDAESILRHTETFNIPLSDLTGLGQQLSDNNIGYLPHQLYPGTGSNHGIDFQDLINGGMGTAYHWGVDPNAQQKGSQAISQLAETQAFIQRRGLNAPNGTQHPTSINTTENTQAAVTTTQAADKRPSAQSTAADFVSGRLGISLNEQRVPASVVYFNEDGTAATRSAFDAESILRHTETLNIPLDDLTGLGQQLNDNNIGYLPYQLYPGTGSNHGIDFQDLINGGMGTAYHWGVDANAHLKGPVAEQQLKDSQALIARRGIEYNPQIQYRYNEPAATLASTLNDMGLQKQGDLAEHLNTLLNVMNTQKSTVNS